METLILGPDMNPNQSQNVTDWSLAEGLSFHRIWFKSVNNPNPDVCLICIWIEVHCHPLFFPRLESRAHR